MTRGGMNRWDFLWLTRAHGARDCDSQRRRAWLPSFIGRTKRISPLHFCSMDRVTSII